MPGDDATAGPAATDALVAEMAAASLAPTADPVLEPSRHRTFIKSIVGGAATVEELVGRKVVVGGWVKTGREQGKGTFAFLELNDGSCLANLQVIVDAEVFPLSQLVATGTCVLVEGVLKKPPEGTKQRVELKVEQVLEVGPVDPSKYPLPKTRLTLEFLRDFVHLRARTNTISAVERIRDELAYATHTFFRQNGFRYVHTPIITTSDCEGAGEMFQVTTLFSDAEKVEKELKQNPPPSESEIEAAKLLVKERGEVVACLKSSKSSKEEVCASVSELTKAKESLAKLEERFMMKPGIPQKDGRIDYAHDFFGRQAFLTVSGQLQVETYACALDMEFMVKQFDKTAIDRLKLVSSTPFVRISYTKAVQLLENVTDKKFENKVEWGMDLASEHERYLTEVIFKKPVIVYNYPKGIKAFYMRLNDDKKTVAAMDVLVPKVGELIGGSQREERLDVLVDRIQEAGLPLEPYEWYLDLRRYGTVKHGGFGLGFERMILFATGLENIRDVIPFPRYPGRADL
ncbi:Asparagine--tRNA ligase, cytoplasmic 3 [Cocos nucifera]|uniref:Asparagine--tRNA ligase, cytoplasmic 3 n=1 Tax=Cocos nucifera TaxID=13894 RepID=A0A8K0I6P6_COCNU|nr:Asparagine--tRNA ligase, cytoplasmic 3 [Cocos nucifera]